MIRKLLAILLNIKGDFQNLFFFNEFNELTGKARARVIALSVILVLTFLALGYAIGGIAYLQEKMDDPFTNWVNLEIKQGYRGKVPAIREDLDVDSMKAKFILNNIGSYRIEFCPIPHRETGEVYNKRLRTINPEEDLLKEILNRRKGNVITGYSYDGNDDFTMDKCGVVIKESTLISLGYEDVEAVQKIPIKIGNIVIYPDVISVVRELPNLVDFVITDHFYRLIYDSPDETNFIVTASSNRFDVISSEEDQSVVIQDIREKMSDYRIASFGEDSLRTEVEKVEYITTVYLRDYYSLNHYDSLFSQVFNVDGGIKYNQYVNWECNVGRDYSEDDDPYYLSFNFEKLDNVRDFKTHMVEKYQVEISMDQIEQKENFALVSNLTGFIAIILFGFSILSIVFYVNSLLRTHLEKIKTNLGTLKAFGLSNQFLISSYLKIILTFIGVSIIIAYVICAAWNVLESYIFAKNYFDVFNIRIVAAIVIIILTALLTSQRTISKTLLKTPGDLIYNR